MSKFYLPTQKGLELFPTSVVAPPVIRWVGVDPRTSDGQAILDTFGSAITSFHMQQAHNHSLSVNNQSRSYRQIAPNIGVEYVNQGGTEYITIYAQLAPQQVVEEEENEGPAKVAGPCWYPTNEISGTVAPSEELVFSQLPLITKSYTFPGEPGLTRSTPVVSGTVSLNFSEPLLVYGHSVTELGLSGSEPAMWLGAECQLNSGTGFYVSNPANVPILGFDHSGSSPVASYYDGIYTNTAVQLVSNVSMARGALSSADDSQPRNYVVLRWSGEWREWYLYAPDEPAIFSYDYEVIIVEAARRPGRAACPALIGFSRPRVDYSVPGYPMADYGFTNASVAIRNADWSLVGYLGSTYDLPQVVGGDNRLPYAPAYYSTGTQTYNPYDGFVYTGIDPAITRTWIALDPDTGRATSLSPNFRWADDRLSPWPPDKVSSVTYYG